MDTISILIITKGHTVVNIALVITLLVLNTSNHGLQLNQVSQNIRLQLCSGHHTIVIITKRHNSVNIAHLVALLFFLHII